MAQASVSFKFPSKSNVGNFQDGIGMPSPETKNNHQLPDNFTTVPAVALKKANVAVPKTPNPIKAFEGHLGRAHMKEKCWLEHSLKLIEKEELDKGDIVAWSAYHASLHDVSDNLQPRSHTALAPVLWEGCYSFHDQAWDGCTARSHTVSESRPVELALNTW